MSSTFTLSRDLKREPTGPKPKDPMVKLSKMDNSSITSGSEKGKDIGL